MLDVAGSNPVSRSNRLNPRRSADFKQVSHSSIVSLMKVRIQDTFEIKGRGLVVCLETTVPYGIGKAHPVQILVDGQKHDTYAHKEWLRRTDPTKPIKNDCFLLDNLVKDQVSTGSLLEFLEPL